MGEHDPNGPMPIVDILRREVIASGKDDPVPDPNRAAKCFAVGCTKAGDKNKRCGKCFVAMYCSKECQIANWKAHKPVCKCNRAFVLNKQTEDDLFYLNHNTASYFREKFAGNEEGYERYKGHFDKLGRINSGACFPGRGIDSFTVAVLEIARGVDFIKLKALAELTGEECFNDPALHLETMKGLMLVLEKRHAEGKPTTEEDVLDGVLALGKAYLWMQDPECHDCFRRAKEGFVRLLGEDSAKAVNAVRVM